MKALKPPLTRQRQWLANSLKPNDIFLWISEEYYVTSGKFGFPIVRCNVTYERGGTVITSIWERELFDYEPDAYKFVETTRDHQLQIICENCKGLTAIERHNPFAQRIAFVCNECIVKWHGPVEHPLMCRKCGTMDGYEPCDCWTKNKIDFLYGGPIVTCPVCHERVIWIDSGSGTGFAGGRVYYERYSCGHMEMDESDDIAAAI